MKGTNPCTFHVELLRLPSHVTNACCPRLVVQQELFAKDPDFVCLPSLLPLSLCCLLL